MYICISKSPIEMSIKNVQLLEQHYGLHVMSRDEFPGVEIGVHVHTDVSRGRGRTHRIVFQYSYGHFGKCLERGLILFLLRERGLGFPLSLA